MKGPLKTGLFYLVQPMTPCYLAWCQQVSTDSGSMKKNPAILIIGINFSPELTGIGRYTGEMAEWLSAKDAEVSVVTGFPYYPGWKVMKGYRSGWYRHELIAGIPVLRCPLYVPRNPSAFRRIMQDLSFFISSWLAVTLLLIKGKRFDHVWVAVPSFLSAIVGHWYRLWKPSTRLHIHVMDLQVDAAGSLGMIRNRWMLKALSVLENASLRRADRVSCLTAGMRNKIEQKGVPASRICLLPIWVDTERFRPSNANNALLSQLGIPSDRRMILYSGSVGNKQGLERIPELARLAAKQGLEPVFVIAGEGPYVDLLKQFVEREKLSNLLFIPLQSDDVFPSLLNSAWLHLVLQKDAGSENYLPSKLIPVWSVGGLALVTAHPASSLGSLIMAYQIGKITSGTGPAEILQVILHLSEHPDEVVSIKANARKFALERCSKDMLLSEYWSEALEPPYVSEEIVI